MSKSTHSNWKKKPLKKLTCLHFELGPQTPGLVGSSAIFNGAKVFIATKAEGRRNWGGRPAPLPPSNWFDGKFANILVKISLLIICT